jgi:hypothetical protein
MYRPLFNATITGHMYIPDYRKKHVEKNVVTT